SQYHESIPATQFPIEARKTGRKIVLDSQFPEEDEDFSFYNERMGNNGLLEEDSVPETQYEVHYRQPSTAPSTPQRSRAFRQSTPLSTSPNKAPSGYRIITPHRTTTITTNLFSPHKTPSRHSTNRFSPHKS